MRLAVFGIVEVENVLYKLSEIALRVTTDKI